MSTEIKGLTSRMNDECDMVSVDWEEVKEVTLGKSISYIEGVIFISMNAAPCDYLLNLSSKRGQIVVAQVVRKGMSPIIDVANIPSSMYPLNFVIRVVDLKASDPWAAKPPKAKFTQSINPVFNKRK
jgi:hypothetical protein